MYCPQCGAQNEQKPSYCRQCGQPLTNVQLALDGRIDEVVANFSKAEDLVAGGLLTFTIFVLSGVVSMLLGGLVPFAVCIIAGFLICLPIVIKGLVRVDRLRRLLDQKATSSDAQRLAGQPAAALPAARINDTSDMSLRAPGSVTDHTTLNLKAPGPK